MPPPPVLCELRLNPTHPDAATDLQDTHRMHKRVLTTLRNPSEGRALWSQPDDNTLLIQADTPADHSRLPAGYTQTARTRPVQLAWSAGQRLRFGLIANPTRVPPGHGRGRNRRPLPVAERDAWLHRKLGPALTVSHLDGHPLGSRVGHRPAGRVTHAVHCWTGTGTVVDPDMLVELITAGVGPAKGYGCGLLLVGPA